MAFNRPNNAANDSSSVQPFSRPPQNTGGNGNFRKADAFINIYMPTRDGGQTKLGALTLTADKNVQKQILDFITDGGDEALASLKERLILDFKLANGGNGVELDLG